MKRITNWHNHGNTDFWPITWLWTRVVWFRSRPWWNSAGRGIIEIHIWSLITSWCARNNVIEAWDRQFQVQTVTGEFPTQRPVTRSFDVFLDLRLKKRLSKQSWGWWFETPSRSLWRHCYEARQNHVHISWDTGLILGLRPANERLRYKVTASFNGWAQT